VQVPAQHQTERIGVRAVGLVVEQELRWLFREQPTSDYGVDAHIEVVDAGHASGRLIAVQIKAGTSYFREPTAGGWVFRFDDGHAEYWLNHSLPVIVVLYAEDARIGYWQAITTESVRGTREEYKVIVPSAQRLDGGARDTLGSFAREPRPGGDRFADRLAALLYRLPDQVSSCLKQLYRGFAVAADCDSDQPPEDLRPVERLAQFLVDGNSDPRAAVVGLLSKPPKWLVESAAAPDLWIAVAGYACDHNAADLAWKPFLHALEAGAAPAGRWRAFAGVTMSESDPEQAHAILDQALKEDGGALLASVGIAALEARVNQLRGPIQIPAAVEQALGDAVQAAVLEPTVRLFVADQYLAVGDLSAAIEALETALSQLPGATGVQLKLANALLSRVVQGMSPLRDSDLYRAHALAEVARADRRRWAGPSEEAATLLLQVRSIAQDYSAAVATAIPAPDGEAIPREAQHPALAEHAITIAIRTDDRRADVLEQQLTDKAVKVRLAALRADASGAAMDDRREAWRQALAAAGDDEQRVIAVRALALLGEDRTADLQDLLDMGGLAAEEIQTLKTIAEVSLTDSDSAIVQLRPLARTSLEAAHRLAELLEAGGRVDEAINVWDGVAQRFGEHAARLAVLDILTRAGRYDEAATRMLWLLARTDLPGPLRDQLRRGLIDDAQRRRDWLTAEAHAEQGLAETRAAKPPRPGVGRQPLLPEAVDYSWLLIGARYNGRDISRAAAALHELQPPIRNVVEANLWLRVVHLAGWTLAEARHAIELAHRFEQNASFAGAVIVALTNATASVPGENETGACPPVRSLVLDETTGRSLVQLAEQYHRQHPDGPIRKVKADPATLLGLVRARADFDAHLDRLRDVVWLGLLTLGVFAQVARVPYMQVLLQRAAGIFPACDPDPSQYDADVAAARAALDHKIVVEPSAIAVGTLLNDRWSTLVAQFSTAVLPRVCYDDLLAARQAIDHKLRVATTLGVDPSTGQVTSHTLSDAERRYLANRISTVQVAVNQLQLVDVTDLRRAGEAMTRDVPKEVIDAHSPYQIARDGAWLAPLEVALTDGLTVWSDDFVLRRTLRELGVATFGTLALLHALYENERLPDTTEQDLATLFAEHVVDLPRRADLIIAQARADQWHTRAGAIAIARAAWWWSEGTESDDISNAFNDYLRIAQAVYTGAPHQLPAWFSQAAQGFAALTTDEHRAAMITQIAGLTITEITGLTPQAVQALIPAANAVLIQTTRIANAPTAALQPNMPSAQPPEPDLADGLRTQLHHWLITAMHQGGAGLSEDDASHLLDQVFADGGSAAPDS
jgi:tetratricopeptide (TPR) repeat protein